MSTKRTSALDKKVSQSQFDVFTLKTHQQQQQKDATSSPGGLLCETNGKLAINPIQPILSNEIKQFLN